MPTGNHADLIVINAKIWTGDPARPEAAALAVKDGRFIAIGDARDVDAWRGPGTRMVDAAGERVIPGLIDAHVHLIGGGLQLARLNLRDVPDRAAFIAAVAERARQTPKGEWILGGRWSTESWPDPSPSGGERTNPSPSGSEGPVKEWIDPVTPDHPVLLVRMDGHSALANSAALRLAGIDRHGPADPLGGKIDRDPRTGEPTGFLREGAVDLVSRLIPKETPAQLDAALSAAMDEAHRHGVTTVHTVSEWAELKAMVQARDEGRLTLRVRFYVSEDDWTKYLEPAKKLFQNPPRQWWAQTRHGVQSAPQMSPGLGVRGSETASEGVRGDDMLRVAGFKQFMDGSLGSRTAYMAEPYADNPEHAGETPTPPGPGGTPTPPGAGETPAPPSPEPRPSGRAADRPSDWRGLLTATAQKDGEMLRLVKAADAADFGTAVHAIGDQANHLLLGIYEETIRVNGPRAERRLRIEHAQHLLPGDIPRFARLGVVASMQPLHKADDARYAEQAIGAARCRTSYAFRSLLDSGAHVAFGSDWPVVTINPFAGMYSAVTGLSLDGKPFVPEQNIRIDEALRWYTAGGAYAAGDETSLGRIAPGYLADFVILDDDLLSVAPERISDVTVRQTYVAGKQVWPQ